VVFNFSCAVTGPPVTRQEEEAARNQIKQADYRIWWNQQKRLFRVSDRFAWGVNTPGAPYRNAIGILPVLRKSASHNELGLYEALGNPRDGTVFHVSVGSPGERAGIEEGDVIVAVDDRNISGLSMADLSDFATKGQTTRFSFIKHGGGEMRTVGITPSRKLDIDFLADRSQEINASAGNFRGANLVNINYGIFNLIQSDDELAIFVGHEVVHILKHHQDQSNAIRGVGGLFELGIAIVGAARGVDTTGLRRGISALTNIVDIRYTREQEREADYLGMYAAHQAGFNVEVAPVVWERFAVATPESTNDNFMRNHPANPERLVRIQKTTEEIRQGRTLQQAWFGDSSDTQLATNNAPQSPAPTSNSSSAPIVAYTPPTSSSPTAAAMPPDKVSPTPATTVSSFSSNAVPSIEKNTMTKTYASLIQYDGPKVKSGITLEAEFIDDGSGSGEGRVTYPGNSYVLTGKWTTLSPYKPEATKLIDQKTLNAMRFLADAPLVSSRFTDNSTVLECLDGETTPLGQRKGECQDNYGNKYHLVFRP